MDIVKYFYEEPAALETLSPDLDPDARRQDEPARSLEALLHTPRYYRGYLAGTDLATNRIGLTALPHRDAFIPPLLDWLHAPSWIRGLSDKTPEPVAEAAVPLLLRTPGSTTVLACSDEPLPPKVLIAVAGEERRYVLPALRALLDQARVVCFPEPAHHGFDWSFFSAEPMRENLVAAFHRHPAEGVRRFVLPFQQARSEHKFYFESWQLDTDLPDYIEEV